MEFGIEIPTGKAFDAVALGLNAVDHLIVVPHYPAFNSKVSLVSHTIAPGGQCATAMVCLARLGMRARYIGKVGSDDLGRLQIQSLESEGVESSWVMVVEGADSQIAFIVVDQASGERTVIWHRDERLMIGADEVDQAAVTSGRALLLDGHNVAASIAAAQIARAAGIPTVLDIDNIYPGSEELLPLIDFLISSASFPMRMTEEPDLRVALKKLKDMTGSFFVAATLGREGVLAYFQEEYIHSPAFSVDCKDTTGAGDAFHGGFMYGLLSGLSVEETLRFANAVAGLKCRAIGARTALPTLEEVNALLVAPAGS
ncbi:MAG TPA: PfkB family carbohydrate kinase [Blastocatellia bacterium]|nr:PfkB family carbohydrate kinase [Blastocatellia bacterium]